MRELDPGDPVQLGKFRLLKVLGAGGMGKVFLGRHVSSGTPAAVKILTNPRLRNDEARHRLHQEIQSCMRVGPEHTAAVQACDVTDDPPWLAIDYLKAPTLQELVAREGALPVRTVRWMAVRLATTLLALRDLSIVHRDIKPSNIIMDASGPKLIDFGIAKELGRSPAFTSGRKGTPGYMSPEQAIGGAALTHATDIYSLGVTIAFTATGRHPQLGANDMIARDAAGRAVFTGLPAELAGLVAHCTHQRASERITAEGIIAAATEDGPHTPAGEAGDTERRRGALTALPSRAGKVLGEYAEQATEARPQALQLPDVTVPHRVPSPPAGAVEPRWRVRLGGNGYYASPVLAAGGAVLAGGQDGLVRALDPADGRELWRSGPHGRVDRTPAVHQASVYFSTASGDVWALNTRDGSVRWRVVLAPAAGSAPAVAVEGGVLVVGDHNGAVRALDLASGAERWRFRAEDAVEGPPAVLGGLVYVASWDHHVYALRADSGEEVWRYDAEAAISSPPAASGGLVLCGTLDGAVHAADTVRGRRRWTFQTEKAVHSAPAVSGDVVYVGSDDQHLYAIDVADGLGIWTFGTGGAVRSSPLVHGGAVYFGSRDHTLYAVDARSGLERGRFTAAGWLDSSPVTDGAALFTGDWERHITAIEMRSLGAGRTA
ncbi:Serine/threonine protein kinase [Actinomadura madurae]|uniref:Serine/threonine protein kinase n=1 Tax=Actinomadura madurae TaxID=1993 RepID=A0A1I5MGR3_9ACTN|nr:PQQ-binding-like beta-propeller repeat protein [Actinomadura madurae]SFP08497.1 Serine/threonine protein kinase [Actinomadura madurae]